MAIEINVSQEALRSKKILISTPMYGGMCAGHYAKSCTDLKGLAAEYGMEIDFFYLFNESLIPRARNYLVDEFLRSNKYTHLMFIDADIGFDPSDVVALSIIADSSKGMDIVCGPYPKKCISWEKIKRAVDKGFADKDPGVLERYVGDYVFNPAAGATEIRLDEPVEVLEGGTGFMMIPRDTFSKFSAAYPEINYKPDHVRTEHFDGSRYIGQYFQAEIDRYSPIAVYESIVKRVMGGEQVDPAEVRKMYEDAQDKIRTSSERYLSEDYWFCQKARAAGMKVWLCPWMRLQHFGTYMFGGSLIDLAQIGASATADASALGKRARVGKK